MTEKKALLEFGTTPSFPAMVLPDVEGFNTHLQSKQANYFEAKADQIKQEYEDLVDLAKDTEMVNSVITRFEPATGKTYWLYESKQTGMFLSIISPSEWTESTKPPIYYGAFQLSVDGTWNRQP